MAAIAADADVVLVANARMPSQRAQSIQVAYAAHAFASLGRSTTLIHARRRDTPRRPADEIWRALGVEADGRPALVDAPCSDWIDRVPRRLQFGPARLQEWTFGRAAARLVLERFDGAVCVARDVEVVHGLRRRGRVACEIHRVPGGRLRRAALLAAADRGVPFIAISGGVRDDLAQLGIDPERITVEHDAVDPGLASRVPARAEARRALGLDPDQPVVLYAGGLLEWKGVDVALEAARSRGFGEALLLIVGGMDSDVARLRSRSVGVTGVRIDGFRPAADVLAYLGAADVGLVPNRKAPRISSHYTSPLKVFEALSVGLPLVMSDLPSLRDAAPQDLASFVPAEDSAALGGAVSALLADPAARTRLADRGRAFMRTRTWRARAKRILRFIEASW